MTNNPNKLKGLETLGVKVTRRIPHIMVPNEFNAAYLKTKQTKSGHMLAEQGEEV
jgi:GTP cyclohydrolase II